MATFMEDLLANLKNVTEPFTYEATNVDGLFKYLKTIDWSERWLIALIVFHLTISTLIVLTGRTSNFQIVLFLLLCNFKTSLILLTGAWFFKLWSILKNKVGLVAASERINELGFKYWRLSWHFLLIKNQVLWRCYFFRCFRLFAMEQYFDSEGIFIGVVFSGPIILNCCLLLVLFWIYLKINQ